MKLYIYLFIYLFIQSSLRQSNRTNSLTHSNQESTVENRQVPLLMASLTSSLLLSNHLIFRALKYVESGRPHLGWNQIIIIITTLSSAAALLSLSPPPLSNLYLHCNYKNEDQNDRDFENDH